MSCDNHVLTTISNMKQGGGGVLTSRCWIVGLCGLKFSVELAKDEKSKGVQGVARSTCVPGRDQMCLVKFLILGYAIWKKQSVIGLEGGRSEAEKGLWIKSKGGVWRFAKSQSEFIPTERSGRKPVSTGGEVYFCARQDIRGELQRQRGRHGGTAARRRQQQQSNLNPPVTSALATY